MMKEEKKNEELKFSSFFLERLNKRYHTDYYPELNNDEFGDKRDIDIYAIDRKNNTLNLQITTGEPELKEHFAQLRKESKTTGKSMVMGEIRNLNLIETINKIVDKKELKSPTTAQNLILLITEDFGPIFNEDFIKQVFVSLIEKPFKGIYLIKFPTNRKNSSNPHKGQVIAIKDIFGNHGKIF